MVPTLLKKEFNGSIYAKKIIKALEFVASPAVREQATVAGSLYLQRDNPTFCSDITVILGSLGAKLKFYGQNASTVSIDEFLKNASGGPTVMTHIELTIPSAGILTIGKVTSRPTMSAGYLTYAFYSSKTENKSSLHYYNAGEGVNTPAGPDEFNNISINQFLACIDNVSVRCLFFKGTSDVEILSPILF